MGVRGLTSFIAQNAEQYLKPYELHDCNLVIDGDNLACNLYKDVTGTYSAFGGDYDDFYRAVVDFFHVLAECNIQAFVLMDGGYELRKLRTVAKRLRGKISIIKRINPSGSITVFPLHMKEVFIDAVRDAGVPVMRCVFEADDELAALARKLHCPVLSYDSDFYIFNVRYIPLITLTVKAHTKVYKEKTNENEPERRLRKNEAKHVEKRTKSDRIMESIVVDNVEKKSRKQHAKTYKYLDCCMYRVENLIRKGSLSKEKMPLFAAMLGNDYIARSSFRNFFQAGMGKIGRSRKVNHQQRRIRLILKWLKDETLETALERIMTRLKMPQRKSLMAQVELATSGYSNEKCCSYEFFMENYEGELKKYHREVEDDESIEGSDIEDNEETVEEEDISENDEEIASSEEEIEEDDDNGNIEEATSETESSENDIESNNAEEQQSNDSRTDNDEIDLDKTRQFPVWFLRKLYAAHFPRYFVDLMHLRKYINSPQIEHFPYEDCHEIAVPILNYIFTLLHSVEGEELKRRIAGDGTELPVEFTYLTRAQRVTNIRYYSYGLEEGLQNAFDPYHPDALLMRKIFEKKVPKLDTNHLFKSIELLPEDLQLYFLSIVYWLHNSQHCDLIHMHSLIICLIVLRTVDSKIPPVRDLKIFQKRFGKIIKKERQVRDKEVAEGIKRSIKLDLLPLTIPQRMHTIPKSDCFLVQDNLLKHFHMQEIFKKKYDLYSSTVVHAFAEFQSIVFQLRFLNALLDFPLESPRMGQLFCGVFVYNLYDLLQPRLDIRYYVENFVFRDSQMMFDFYCYLVDWCDEFIPHWKRNRQQTNVQIINKKALKKQRQNDRKKSAAEEYAESLNDCVSENNEEDDFFDLNNKFSEFLMIR